MKKLFVALLICAIVSFGLMGCGKKTDTGRPGHEHPASEHPR